MGDSEMQTLQADLEEMLCESRIAEDKAKKAMIDAARLADELRAEQENAQFCEKNRRSLECQVKDMQTKLDEAEQQAVKGGRKVTSRLEQKIKDLESQFDDEQRRLVEAEKSQRRTTRRIKELTFSQEEDHKNHERMQELVGKLQNKVKSYKKQIEEPRRSLLSTLPSSARCKLILSLQRSVLISMSRFLPSTRRRQEVQVSDQTDFSVAAI